MNFLRMFWIYVWINIYVSSIYSSAIIGHLYNQKTYNSTSAPFVRLNIQTKLICAIQCAFQYASCITVVFDRSLNPSCLLFNEGIVLARLVPSYTAVVYDFQNTKVTVQCSKLFNSIISYSTGLGSNPKFLSVVDVDNDNRLDIIYANYNQHKIGIFRNYGNGTFIQQATYSTGLAPASYPQSVTGKDVNGDNIPDIIVANNGGNNVGVFLNTGNGTFLSQVTYITGAPSYPPSATTSDVNNDNKSDIIVANQYVSTIGVLFNLGNGTFGAQKTYSAGISTGPTSVVANDVNNDGYADIIFAKYDTGGVGVLLNVGNGTFLPVVSYFTGNGSKSRSVFVSDVNNDNKPDIIVSNQFLNTIGVFLNIGNGTFGPQTTYSTGNNSDPVSVIVSDINNDTKPDIIVTNYGTNAIGLLINVGDGTFFPQTTCSTGTNSQPQSVSVNDVNNDNKMDIIVANYGSSSNIGVMFAK